MRWMRRASCLSVVIGAGATMDAGGPSWAALVRRLLARLSGAWPGDCRDAADPGKHAGQPVSTDAWLRVNERLPADAESRARAVLALIDAGTADVEALLEGAQICHDFLGQALFTDLTGILYEGQRRPGADPSGHCRTRRTDRGPRPRWRLPRLGRDHHLQLRRPDGRGSRRARPGTCRLCHARQAACRRSERTRRAPKGDRMACTSPSTTCTATAPRRLFLITQVDRSSLPPRSTPEPTAAAWHGIVGEVFARCLANPVRHALYVGCSFD
jgi:hypothetical protein